MLRYIKIKQISIIYLQKAHVPPPPEITIANAESRMTNFIKYYKVSIRNPLKIQQKAFSVLFFFFCFMGLKI